MLSGINKWKYNGRESIGSISRRFRSEPELDPTTETVDSPWQTNSINVPLKASLKLRPQSIDSCSCLSGEDLGQSSASRRQRHRVRIERATDGQRHFVRHRHAPARQGQHQRSGQSCGRSAVMK